MAEIENPTSAELKATLEDADLPIGKSIEARLGKDPRAHASSEEPSSEEE